MVHLICNAEVFLQNTSIMENRYTWIPNQTADLLPLLSLLPFLSFRNSPPLVFSGLLSRLLSSPLPLSPYPLSSFPLFSSLPRSSLVSPPHRLSLPLFSLPLFSPSPFLLSPSPPPSLMCMSISHLPSISLSHLHSHGPFSLRLVLSANGVSSPPWLTHLWPPGWSLSAHAQSGTPPFAGCCSF